MRSFGYLRDRLFLAAALAYWVNRCVLKSISTNTFLHNYFNDLLLIPAALPVILWLHRIFKLRDHDRAPSWPEMFFHLTIWTIICEFLGPILFHHGRADLWDVAAYTLGGIAACLWWNRRADPSLVPA